MSWSPEGLRDPGVVSTLTFAAVFAIAALARWRGYDRKVPVLRAIADWVPGVPPLVIAIAALVSIPVLSWLIPPRGADSNVIAAVAFFVLLTVATTVVILTRTGAVPARIETPVLATIFAILLLLALIASPALRDSLAGIVFGLAFLLVAAAAAYLYTRRTRSAR
jgi:hypothetical protein